MDKSIMLSEFALAKPVDVRGVRLPLRRDRRYIRGPIPLGWLLRSSSLGPAALKLALVLFYLKGIRGTGRVVVTRPVLEKFGLSVRSKYRALEAMEAAGLVEVEKRPGRNSAVILLL